MAVGVYPSPVIIQSGVTGDLATVDPTYKALHAVEKPIEALGHYHIEASMSVAAATAAAAPVGSLRWGDATRLMVIYYILLSWKMTTLLTAGDPQDQTLDLRIARSFSASDTGGTVVPLTTNNAKLRTSFPTSLVTDFRTGALTAGTRTLDSNTFMRSRGNAGTQNVTAAAAPGADMSNESDGVLNQVIFNVMPGQHPLVLAQNEGLVVVNITAMPAAGALAGMLEIGWAEVNAF